MPIDPALYFDLTADELRHVVRFALVSAEQVLPLFEGEHPQDPRPRAAVEAARAFADGARRTRLQRVTALDAHRAAREAATDQARHAARAAGYAAAAAYLHPFAKADQVGHVLGAAAQAARAAELASGDPEEGLRQVAAAADRATRELVDVLCRYPPAPTGASRVAVLMELLDTTLRTRASS